MDSDEIDLFIKAQEAKNTCYSTKTAGGGGARCNYFESVNYSLINRCFGQIPGEIVLGLFELTSLRSVNSEKPRTISPGIDLNIG